MKYKILFTIFIVMFLSGCTEIESGSKDFLPTIDDLDNGWQLYKEEVKDEDFFSEEDWQKVQGRGFKEGHFKAFELGSATFGNFDYMTLTFSTSIYSRDKIEEVFQEVKDRVDKGERKYNETEEEYVCGDDYLNCQYEDVTTEVTIKYDYLKNQNIGDESIFYTKTETETDDFFGDANFKTYILEFTKKNVWTQVRCFSFDNTCLDITIEQAKFVEKNIK